MAGLPGKHTHGTAAKGTQVSHLAGLDTLPNRIRSNSCLQAARISLLCHATVCTDAGSALLAAHRCGDKLPCIAGTAAHLALGQSCAAASGLPAGWPPAAATAAEEHRCQPAAADDLCERLATLTAARSQCGPDQLQWWQTPDMHTPAALRVHGQVLRETLDSVKRRRGEISAAKQRVLQSAAEAAGGSLSLDQKVDCLLSPEVRQK